MFGAGHGGIEAIILGGLAGVAFINFVALRNVDVATLPIPVEQQFWPQNKSPHIGPRRGTRHCSARSSVPSLCVFISRRR